MTASDRWAALRALPATAILAALGIDPVRPGCPRCGSRFQVCDDSTFGTSVRCASEGCRLGARAWPEHVLADLLNIDLADAERRLLAATRTRGPVVVLRAGDRPATSLAQRLDALLGAA
ncbi:hypothetical protein BH18GEM1_BH18GEM1_22460 [soil metagenome]